MVFEAAEKHPQGAVRVLPGSRSPMTRKIFLFAFLLGAMVLFLCAAIFFGMQYSQGMNEAYAALQGEASYAASGLQIGGLDYLRSLDNKNRITWIAQDGRVLYDSEYPDLDAGQAEFPEVREALETGAGQGIRRSSSDGTQTMYYAFLCKDGTVLRLSRPLSAVWEIAAAVSPVLWVILLVLLISAAAALRIARNIAEPINEMELEDLPHASPYPELRPLVERMQEQTSLIAQQAVEREQLSREAMEEQAREQERMRREFSANVSHELKTPLTSISGFAELMQSGLCDEEKMVEFAGDIYRESQRLIALVGDIIRISELDEGAVQAPAEEVNLAAEAEKAVEAVLPAAEKRGIRIQVEPEDEPLHILGAEHLIGEMLYNLCDNAVKYNRDGGEVRVRLWKEDGMPCVSVEDTGIGIPEEEQERVFERFYRVDKSHSRKVGGTGLGLSIVKHAAPFHNVSIEMESEPGRGTKITLRFPGCL